MSHRSVPPLLVAPRGAWSWTRLSWVVLAILALHVGLLFGLSRRAGSSFRSQASEPLLAPLVWDHASAHDPLGELLPDPVVFARVVAGGFSGSLWERDTWVNSGRIISTPHVLRPPLSRDLSLHPRLDVGLAAPNFTGRDAPSPARVGLPPQPRLPGVPNLFAAQSVLRLREGLSGWQPLLTGTLPVWTNAQLLLPTVVQVLLDPQGGVLSATLELGSGLAEADQEALKRARQLRFAPAPALASSEGPRWGRLEFVWYTVSPGLAPPTASP